jgi:hypothetical protein
MPGGNSGAVTWFRPPNERSVTTRNTPSVSHKTCHVRRVLIRIAVIFALVCACLSGSVLGAVVPGGPVAAYDKAANRTTKVVQKCAAGACTTTAETFLYGTPATGCNIMSYSGGTSVLGLTALIIAPTAPLADPDSDGLVNLLERALGGDPLSGDSSAT